MGWVCLFGLVTMIYGCSVGCGQDPSGTQRPVDDGRVRTPIGLSFVPPEEWDVVASPAAASIRPPEFDMGTEEYLLVLRFAPQDLKSPSEIGTDYLKTLAEEFEGKVPDAGRVEPALELVDKESVGGIAWDIEKAQGVKRVAFYMVLEGPWMLVLRVSAPRERVESLAEPLSALFESVELEKSTIDPALVGTWARGDGTDGDTPPAEMVLQEDGTLRVWYDESSMAGEDAGDLGRWAVRGEEFYQYVGSRRDGGVWMESQAWSLTDGGRLLEIGEGGDKNTWIRQK
jgi:hypothetical protein